MVRTSKVPISDNHFVLNFSFYFSCRSLIIFLHCFTFLLKQSKGNPLGVKALKRTAAKPHWAVGGGKSSSA